jgi:hypothetical protein
MRTLYASASAVMFEHATHVAKAIDLEEDLLLDWARLALQTMTAEINEDPKNSTALMQTKYDRPCKLLLQEARDRLRELLEQWD